MTLKSSIVSKIYVAPSMSIYEMSMERAILSVSGGTSKPQKGSMSAQDWKSGNTDWLGTEKKNPNSPW